MAQTHTLCMLSWLVLLYALTLHPLIHTYVCMVYIQDVEESYSEGGGSSSEETAYVSCSSDEEENSSFITFEASPAQFGL